MEVRVLWLECEVMCKWRERKSGVTSISQVCARCGSVRVSIRVWCDGGMTMVVEWC